MLCWHDINHLFFQPMYLFKNVCTVNFHGLCFQWSKGKNYLAFNVTKAMAPSGAKVKQNFFCSHHKKFKTLSLGFFNCYANQLRVYTTLILVILSLPPPTSGPGSWDPRSLVLSQAHALCITMRNKVFYLWPGVLCLLSSFMQLTGWHEA